MRNRLIGRLTGERGAGVVEAVIAITVMSLVLAAMVGVFLHQQRFYLVTGDASNKMTDVERIQRILTAELLPVNPAVGDVAYAGADSLVFRAFRGVYAVCGKQGSSEVQLIVRALSGSPPLKSDSAFIYELESDAWGAVPLGSVQPAVCADGTQGWRTTVPGASSDYDDVIVGTPVRAFRWARYWLTTHDGSWFVKTDALSGSPMVVSGPLAPADSAVSAVVRFRYLDSDGDPPAGPAEIDRVEIDVTAVGAVTPRKGGAPLSKSRTVAVKLRNARK